jgi:hypothetical protein
MAKNKLLEELQSFAVLTEEIGPGRAPRPATPGSPVSPGTSQLGQIVDGALREVLGWRPRTTDAQGFVAALNQSFSVKEVEGHIEWKWTPRSYAVAAELGAVTGAQASIYSRAKAMLDQSIPLLEGLHPLNAAFDVEDVEAIRAIVKSSLTELVAELGREGGPRIARVDELFFQLFATDKIKDLDDTEDLDGQLGLLRERFGLERKFVNTIDEEQNLTNYLIIADNTISLRFTWDQQKKFFDLDATDVFLGTQTVLLSRALAVVAESVEETYFVMDSVFLGSAERQVLELHFDGSDLPAIFLGDLLSWVEMFATDEGPRLIRDGGKDGVVEAFSKTADKLFRLVEATEGLSAQGGVGLPASFRTARVQRALGELRDQLANVSDLAEQIRREPQSHPVVILVSPLEAEAVDGVRLTVLGSDFQRGMTRHAVKLTLEESEGDTKTEFLSEDVDVRSENGLVAEFNLARTPSGSYSMSIEITNPDGGKGAFEGDFEIILSEPEVDRVNPPQSEAIDGVRLTVFGRDFQRGMEKDAVKLTFEGGSATEIFSDNVDVRSETKLHAIFDLTDADPGNYSIEITNPDGGTVSLEEAFEVSGEEEEEVTEVARRTRPRSTDGHRGGAIVRAGSKRPVKRRIKRRARG